MDSAAEEGPGLAVLGEHDSGHAGGTVHGGGGDLWGGHLHPLPGETLITCKIGNTGIL